MRLLAGIFFIGCVWFHAGCATDRKESGTEELLADSVRVLFYNGSLSPPHQFYREMLLFDTGYSLEISKGIEDLNPETSSGKIAAEWWNRIRSFNPRHLHQRQPPEGESFVIFYFFNDTSFVHYPEQLNENEEQLFKLITGQSQ